MGNQRRWSVLLVLVLGALGCVGKPPIRVGAERNPSAEFGALRTYRWARPPLEDSPGAAQSPDSRLDWRIRNAVDRALRAKGYVQETSGGSVGFLIDYDVVVEDRRAESFREVVAYHAVGGTRDTGEAFSRSYQHATLTLEASNPTTRALLWRAWASGMVDEQQPGRRIDEAVDRMLAQLPAR